MIVYPRETPPHIRAARASPQRHTAAGTAAPTTADRRTQSHSAPTPLKRPMLAPQAGSVEWRTTQNKDQGGDYGHHMSRAACNIAGAFEMMMICLPPQGTPPHTQQPTRPTAHTARSQHCGHTALPPGQKTNLRRRAGPTQSVYARPFRRAQTQGHAIHTCKSIRRRTAELWPIQDILSLVFVCARINHLFITPAH